MKFGYYLENNKFPPWKNDYLDYNQLKYYLKDNTQLSRSWTGENDHYFIETLFMRELNKLHQFIQLKINQIYTLVQSHDRDIETKVDDLVYFIQLNSIGLQKILKKHDKWTGIPQSQRFSMIYRQFGTYILQAKGFTKQPPKWFTKTYWIHPDNLNQLEAILLFHLPIKKYVNPGGNEIINSIYFENSNQFNAYSNLLEKRNSSEIIRARWYGLANDNSNVFIEKKKYHEPWAENNMLYTKQRMNIPYSSVSNFLNTGHYLGPQQELAKEVYEKSRGMRSVLRCYHYRKTFQQEPTFYVTLDTKVTFMKEMGPTWKRNDIGDSYPFDHLTKDEIHFFPFAILQIKSINEPTWFEENLGNLAYQVPYFSKYLHGASHFFWDRLAILPWWLKEMEKDIRRQEPSKCITIEPPLTPNYFHNSVSSSSHQTLINHSQQSIHRNSMNQSQNSMNHSQNSMNYSQHSMNYSLNHSTIKDSHHSNLKITESSCTVVDNHYESPFATKFKELKETYLTDPNKPDNEIGMRKWLIAKITRDKQILNIEAKDVSFKKGKKKKIEPKIFFANERTFISWLQFSALLFTVSLGLINFGDNISKGSGAFFIIIAMILAFYAQLRFQYRSWQIRFRSDSRFDDMKGPAILCFVLVVALFVNLGLRLKQPLPVNPSPFGYNTNSTFDDIIFNPNNNKTRVDKHGHIIPVNRGEDEEDEEDEA